MTALELERQSRAGCRQLRRARSTGSVIGLYRGDEAGLDTNEGEQPWSLVCDEHGFVSSFETLEAARSFASTPEEWCEVCGGLLRRTCVCFGEWTPACPVHGHDEPEPDDDDFPPS